MTESASHWLLQTTTGSVLSWMVGLALGLRCRDAACCVSFKACWGDAASITGDAACCVSTDEMGNSLASAMRGSCSRGSIVNMPTPANYRLGAGDQVFIDVWGSTQESYDETISPDGYVVLDGIGPVKLGGLTVSQATAALRSRLGRRYSDSNVSLSVVVPCATSKSIVVEER